MRVYRVKPGDTLYNISQRFNVSVALIVDVNDIQNPAELVVGQALLIPDQSPVLEQPEPLIYRVRAGETLFIISDMFKIPINEIIVDNNLKNPDLLNVDQALIIPYWSLISYTVKAADTLYKIADEFNTSLSLLKIYNDIEDVSLIYPGEQLLVPVPGSGIQGNKPEKITLGYFFPDPYQEINRAFEITGPILTYAALFEFGLSPTGKIIKPPYIKDFVQAARQHDILPLMVLSNTYGENLFSSELAHNLLKSPGARNDYIQQALSIMQEYDFYSLSIDFENMYPEDRELYNTFVRELKTALGQRPLFLAVAPKWSDLPNQPWVGAFDYQRLGQIADYIYIMTYEWSWVGGPPGPIAPVNNVRRVLEYALSLMPRTKILQGLPLYGYRWQLPLSSERLAVPVTLPEAIAIARKYGAVINYDERAEAPWFRYTDNQGNEYEIWFEDVESIWEKLKINEDLDLAGFGYWSFKNIPYGSRPIRYLISHLFDIVKLL